MHAPYILSADDLDDFSGIYRKPFILAADDFLGACYRKAMTHKKLWTLLFSQSVQTPLTMCFLTVSSRPCLETTVHSILRTPFVGHCLGAL